MNRIKFNKQNNDKLGLAYNNLTNLKNITKTNVDEIQEFLLETEITDEIINKFIKHPDSEVRYLIALREELNKTQISDLQLDDCVKVRMAIATRKDLNREHLLSIKEDYDFNVQFSYDIALANRMFKYNGVLNDS